jgi:hypothetical protein
MANTCIPRYVGGLGRRGLRPFPGQKHKTISEKLMKIKRTGILLK